MKRERERKWYYVYGNLTQRFTDDLYCSGINNLIDLLKQHNGLYKFETWYPIEYGDYSLKEKHYIQILHTVILDFFGEIPEQFYDLSINTTSNTNNQIYLYFIIKAKQKDEEIFIGETAKQSDGREQPI